MLPVDIKIYNVYSSVEWFFRAHLIVRFCIMQTLRSLCFFSVVPPTALPGSLVYGMRIIGRVVKGTYCVPQPSASFYHPLLSTSLRHWSSELDPTVGAASLARPMFTARWSRTLMLNDVVWSIDSEQIDLKLWYRKLRWIGTIFAFMVTLFLVDKSKLNVVLYIRW